MNPKLTRSVPNQMQSKIKKSSRQSKTILEKIREQVQNIE